MTTADLTAECDSLRRAARALEERAEVLEETVARLRVDRDEQETERRRAEAQREYERGRAVAAEDQLAEIECAKLGMLEIACSVCRRTISTLGESPAHAAVMLAHQASIQFTTDGNRVVCRPCASKTAPKEAA